MARDDRPPETLDPRRLRASLSSSLGLTGEGRRLPRGNPFAPSDRRDEPRFEASPRSSEPAPEAPPPRPRRSFTWEIPPLEPSPRDPSPREPSPNAPLRRAAPMSEPSRPEAPHTPSWPETPLESGAPESTGFAAGASTDSHPDTALSFEAPTSFEASASFEDVHPDAAFPVDDDGFGRPTDLFAEAELPPPSPIAAEARSATGSTPAVATAPLPPPAPPPASTARAAPLPSSAPAPAPRRDGSRKRPRLGRGERGEAGSAEIVPPQSVAGRALVAVVAIMGFLACLAVGVLSLVVSAAHDWQLDVGREVTIQIKPGNAADLPARLSRALDLARATTGVHSARLVDEREGAALLEPWLGQGLDLTSLPIPRLVVLELDDPAAADLVGLRRRLTTEVSGALLDDHAVWTARLRTMAGAVVVAGVTVVALVFLAMSLTVVFATRSAMAGNREVIEVLHFVGAEDGYVAKQFQEHFLRLGLVGGAIGGVAAIVVFQILRLFIRAAPGDAMADQAQALFGGFSVGFLGHFGVVVVVALVAALTAATSRFTVLDHLKRLD